MDGVPPDKPRPYWHVDAKWVTGLLLTWVLGLALLVFTLVQITAEDSAVDTLSLTMALLFSPRGLDDETEITRFRQQLNTNPQAPIEPIPGLRITLQAADIANLSPRQVRLYVFRQLAEPFYQQGPEGLAALANTPDMQAGLGQGVGPFSVFTLETHQTLQRVLGLLVVICLGLLIPLILFSFRWGRLGSPGCVLFMAGLPGAILFTFVASALQPVATPPQSEEMGDMAGYLAANVLPPLVSIASRNHLVAIASGLGLMVLAVLGGLLLRGTRTKQSSSSSA
jgi:hypothetical protein